MPTYTTIAQVRKSLAPHVRKAGLREVARRSGVAPGHLSTWLSGRDAALSLALVAKVARAVGRRYRLLHDLRLESTTTKR